MTVWLGLLRSLLIYLNPLSLRRWRRFYAAMLAPGDLAFDIGAHVGTRAIAMHRAGARVVAVEPQYPFTGYLRRTLPEPITLVEAAVGDREAEAEMAVSSRHPTVSSLQPRFVADAADRPGFAHVRWDRTQTVRMVTLDGLIARFGRPAYVKIDVEGFELDVLRGLSHPLPLLSFEYLPAFPDLARDVTHRLAELGDYRFNPVVGETGRFLWPDWRDGAATRAWLAARSGDEASGDLFARLSDLPHS